jgi:hypothetical protein
MTVLSARYSAQLAMASRSIPAATCALCVTQMASFPKPHEQTCAHFKLFFCSVLTSLHSVEESKEMSVD